MRRPAALRVYLALSGWQRAKPAMPDARPRPSGPLLWLHVPDAGDLPAVTDLLRRLADDRPDLQVLLTAPPRDDAGTTGGEGQTGAALPDTVRMHPPPPADRRGLSDFLGHWRPDAFAQIGGVADPVLLLAVADAGLRPILVNVRTEGRALSLVPGLARHSLGAASRIFVIDRAAARRMRRLVGPSAPIETIGPLEPAPPAPPVNEVERESIALSLAGRPVWLVSALPAEEVEAVIAAHRAALRLAHRLLLLIVPADPASAPALAARMTAAEGWQVGRRSTDDVIDEGCDVYIADTEDEIGLWLRLAPICYMGGTLSERGSLRPPTEAAALGSAIIHGPQTGAYARAYDALCTARATRALRGAAELGEAVSDLLSPDRAAQLAHNAWVATTSGAEITDRVLRLIIEATKDRKGTK